jgi:DNA-binding beta-propeller fold protein YncE
MLLAAALGACSGGSGVRPGRSLVGLGAPVNANVIGSVSKSTAAGTMIIEIRPATPLGAVRKPDYVSAATTHAYVFINGSATPNNASSTCTGSETTGTGTFCTITWTAALAVPHAYVFDVEISNNAPASVLAVGQQTYALVAGTNTLSMLTLNGVVANANFSTVSCSNVSLPGTCVGTVVLQDAAGVAIGYTGATTVPTTGNNPTTGTVFDNGNVTFASNAASGLVIGTAQFSGGNTFSTFAPNTLTVAGVNTTGIYPFQVSCATGSTTGNFGITVGGGTSPSGDIIGSQRANENPVPTYPSSVIVAKPPQYSCMSGSIFVGQNLYVTNYSNNTVTVYAANPVGNVTSAPLATIGGGSTGLSSPYGVKLDAGGKIYVNNYGSNTVTVYAANPSGTLNEAPLATIGGGSTALSGPAAVAIDTSGKIYVENYNNSTLTVYAANPSGNVTSAPLATIGGGSTGISSPDGIFLDAAGKIYVANAGNNTVTVYAANPSGNVTSAPLATIGGGLTALNSPGGGGFDAAGNIYVANYGNNTITVYAANPSGTLNEAPLATIGGGSTGLSGPTDVSVQ